MQERIVTLVFIEVSNYPHIGHAAKSQFSGDDGSLINTVFWISFAVGRFTGLFTGRYWFLYYQRRHSPRISDGNRTGIHKKQTIKRQQQ
jgi:hypothetical protein